jgi:integral membrane protein
MPGLTSAKAKFEMKTPVSFLRSVALLEAISWLLLLFIAMPLKYAWGMPLAVRIVGSVHGALFVAFCFALWRVLNHTNWPLSRAALVFVASFVPFMPFFIDRRMGEWAAESSEPKA